MVEIKQFGELFRKRRKTLVLSLREFCRLNGFDPGNISRLERGLIKPPTSREILEMYAKSLKLEPGSGDWERFIDLARAETGKVPPEILEKVTTIENLPRMFRRMRERKRHLWTTAVDLERWADTLDSRSRFPQLIRRLIHWTVDSVEFVDFPAGEGVGRPGWDGIVRTQEGNAFVPSGQSGWEMGVGQDSESKANEDFRNRSKNTGGLDPKETVFIFVTPRKWIKKNGWCEEKKKLGKWKDVRVYDSDNLEQWLEIAPVVDAWFGREDGVTDIDEYWENLKLFTEPSLKPEVFLTTRGMNIEILKNWINGPPSSIEFEAESPDELFDFVAAYVASLDDSKRDEIKAHRIVIVDSKEVWQTLIASEYPIVLIPKPAIAVEGELITEALRRGHYVLLWREPTNDPQKRGTRLSRVYSFELESALESSGIQKERARMLARESGGSLAVLKRRIGRFPNTKKPEWAEPGVASDLIPILLAGGWDDVREGDRNIIAELADRSYERMEGIPNRWQKGKDAPIMRVLSHWRFVSREDSWTLLAPHITSGKLERFEQVALEILSEEDPMYELPPEKRWYAAVYNKIPKYSNLLRKSVTETLALLGAKSPPGLIQIPSSPERLVKRIVEKLLSHDASWQRWASLSALLPILAEASPEEFLKAVENDLEKTDPYIFKLFAEHGEPLFSPTPHVGLLWALETLAWHRRYLTKVTRILARLAAEVSQVKSGNNPMNSLIEIFLPWLPQTTVSVEERIKVLRELTELFPDIGVQLLLSLLPTYHGVSNYTHRPLWRDWALNWSDRVLLKDRWQQENACAEILLENARTNMDRWLQLIKKFENFPPPAQDRLLCGLKNFDLESIDTKAKQQIVDTLREKVSKHRRFPDANWALPAKIVDKLEEIQNRFEPEDLVVRYRWLFVPYPSLPDKSIIDEEHEREVLIRRKRVLREIFDSKGLEGIIELAEAVESPYTVGYILAEANLTDADHEILPELLVSENDNISQFARGYTRGRFDNKGKVWVDKLPLTNWHKEVAGKLTSILDFNRQTWDLVSALGNQVSEYYWRHANNVFYQELKKEDVEYAVSKLIEYNRPFRAIDLLNKALFRKCDLSSSIFMEALDAGLKSWQDEKNREPIPNEIWYYVQQLIKKLQGDSKNNPNFDTRRLADLEWGYLGFLDGHGASPITLQGFLQSDPKFFADLLALIYRSRKEQSDSAETPGERQKAKAENAYTLLYKWNTIPGVLEDGTVDEQILIDWVNNAREICKEKGLLEVCDVKIGELFGRAHNKESDGSWPCIPVRDVIEEIGSDALEEGFEVGIFNKRGTVTKSLLEGGEQERVLANEYKSYAEACEIEWPKTASVLRKVAKSYEEYARREDEKAKDRL